MLEEDKSENRLRSEPDERGHVAFEEAERTELCRVPHDIPNAVELARLRVHRASLEHIQRLGQRRCDCASDARRSEVCRQVVGEVSGFQHHLLYLVVERKLADRHEDGTRCGGGAAGEESTEAFFRVDSPQAIDGVFVAKTKKLNRRSGCKVLNSLSSLIERKLHIILHANVDHVSWRSNDAAASSSSTREQDLPEKVQVIAESLLADLVNAKSRR